MPRVAGNLSEFFLFTIQAVDGWMDCIVKKVEGVIFDLWRKAMESSPCFAKEGNG